MTPTTSTRKPVPMTTVQRHRLIQGIPNTRPETQAIKYLFRPNSPLKPYLHKHKPEKNIRHTTYFTTTEVTEWLKDIIFERGLYDDNNPGIVLCDKELEQALNVKALHSAETRQKVAEHLVPERHPLARTPYPTPSFHPSRRYLTPTTTMENTGITLENRIPLVPFDKPIPPKQLFTLRNKFLEVLKHTRKMINKDQTIFTYDEAAWIFMQYIIQQKDTLIDERHRKVVICEDDKLGAAIGVRAFHHIQRLHVVRLQLIPHNTQSPSEHHRTTPQKTNSGRKRPFQETQDTDRNTHENI